MIRKSISITHQQETDLKWFKGELGLSESDLIRRALDDYLLKIKREQEFMHAMRENGKISAS